jgi:hypothetical protein|tara:strand:- start:303 stop:521 length:219 start_codon:yes stop_codon:yes gene_type:complete
MEVGSVIKDKKTGNLGVVIEVRNVNVLAIEKLSVFSVMWKDNELIEDVFGKQLLNERYELAGLPPLQIKLDT